VPLVLRVLPPLVYCGIAAAVFTLDGVPLERDRASLWLLGLLACLSLGSLGGFVRSVFLEWVPLLGALTLYDAVRGLGAGTFPIHAMLQIDLDRNVFGAGHVPTVWLQEHLWNPAHLTWVDYASWGTYMSYFVASPLLLGALWLLDRKAFRAYARQVTLISFASVAVFLVWPSMPPWLAAEKGMIGEGARVVGYVHVPLFDATSVWERGLQLANDVAAFPSLHEGMTILLVLVLWPRVPRWWRVPLAAYPLAMAFALTYMAEHYVVDLVAGAAFAFAVVRIEPMLTRRVVATLRPWLPSRSAATASSSG
jgi:hypothetical protein